MKCSSCSAEVPEGSRFCPSCASPLASAVEDSALAPTAMAPEGGFPTQSRARSQATDSGPATDDGSRFVPGTLLAERYRIVGLLGRGGMGEVYRADDLKLGQTVALKFLPEVAERDEEWLARFLHEVKIARQISNPNVCRVYDIGEVEGHHFLSMEYIDGEDLSSLLRRIGRLPQDKAIQIARQVCAGLAAAHDQGILHRDLKPANVMIDGRGNAKITDFGLAGLAESIAGEEVGWGTPAYMAPEQLAGREVSVRSDIYALGLVLYQLVTGEQAFKADSRAELARLHRDSTPSRPTSVVEGIDPAVERVILRCLEQEPGDRPASALAVSAALPGGDPLAAALAAGETPSPELVAAAGGADAMNPAHALALAVLAVALFALGGSLNGRNQIRAYLPLDKPPAAMIDRAQEIVRQLGYTEPVYSSPVDTAFGHSVWAAQLDWIEENNDSPDRWESLRSPQAYALSLWYRQSPVTMLPRPASGSFAGGRVERWNPFPGVTGEILVSLDLAGHLEFFVCAPRRYVEELAPAVEPDWSLPFELAGLDMANFEPVEPRYQRYMAPDQRAAWEGTRPEAPDKRVRIEAGMSEGRVVLFGILPSTQLESLAGQPANFSAISAQSVVGIGIAMVTLIVGYLLARRNTRQGRADRQGAERLAMFAFAITLLLETLRAHVLFTTGGAGQILSILGAAIFSAALIMMLYLALEPYARRVWPSMLISWTRLLGRSAGGWRDPLIGRSVLFGLVAGSANSLLGPLDYLTRSAIEGAPARPDLGNWASLLGQRHALAEVVAAMTDGLMGTLFLTFLLVAARMVLRRQWFAIVAVAAVAVFLFTGVIQDSLVGTLVATVFAAAGVIVLLAVLLRFGLVGLLAAMLVGNLEVLVSTPNWTAWHAQPAILALVVVAALAGYGFWAASAGRSFIGEEALDRVGLRP